MGLRWAIQGGEGVESSCTKPGVTARFPIRRFLSPFEFAAASNPAKKVAF